ncbi:MAG: B-box zinc finger protein [Acidobacteriota bacterium]|nr:B-box zinc finger protein [Acidobacteriota bacterium]
MNCVNHPQTPSTAFCRTCGKALCEECKRDVRGVIYCEDCIVARLGDAIPAAATLPGTGTPTDSPYVGATVPGAPNPALAAILGAIPFGIGAVYNGQYAKALAHLVTFALLIVAVDNSGPAEPLFGLMIAFFVFYQIFDAYRTAKAKQLGLPVPDPGGIYRALGIPLESSPGTTPAASPIETPRSLPFGAMVLIGIGFLFLLQNIGWFHFHWIGKLWPLILIVIGLRMLMRNRPAGS